VSQHIRYAMFSDINISQGSVATPLRCGGICNDLFIANFLLSVTVKEFLKNDQTFVEISTRVWQLTFLSHPVYGHGTSTSQTDRQTDGRMTYDSNTVLARASHGDSRCFALSWCMLLVIMMMLASGLLCPLTRVLTPGPNWSTDARLPTTGCRHNLRL